MGASSAYDESVSEPALPAKGTNVLIVEDEPSVRDGLEALFSSQGFGVQTASDGQVALSVLARDRFDLVVLDLMIPRVPGLDVLRAMRGRGDATCVLILTAKGTEDDVVAGLEAGADDYVVKPFGVRELVARAKGLLRRPAPPSDPSRPRSVGDVVIDVAALELRRGAAVLPISAREAALLAHLVQHADRVVPRDELLVEVWGYRDGGVRTRTVDVHVQKLRTKIRDFVGSDDWIATARGAGYRFVGLLT